MGGEDIDTYCTFVTGLHSVAFGDDTHCTLALGIRSSSHAKDFLVGEIVSPVHHSTMTVRTKQSDDKKDLQNDCASVDHVALEERSDCVKVFLRLILGRVCHVSGGSQARSADTDYGIDQAHQQH